MSNVCEYHWNSQQSDCRSFLYVRCKTMYFAYIFLRIHILVIYILPDPLPIVISVLIGSPMLIGESMPIVVSMLTGTCISMLLRISLLCLSCFIVRFFLLRMRHRMTSARNKITDVTMKPIIADDISEITIKITVTTD